MSERVPVNWVVVADGARARIYEHTRIGGGLAALAAMDHDKAHGHARDLGSDRPGRVFDSTGAGRHAVAPHTDYLRYEKDKFAHEIAALLEHAGTGRRFDRLVLVAPPRTLGDLRAAMGAHAKAAVIGEVHKDLTHAADRDIAEHLGAVMAV
ncbi:MAG: host attachment protein [Alphaproteobacteria bacterium]|nr:host attachment protein [Alphaproteobacteria bacterium]